MKKNLIALAIASALATVPVLADNNDTKTVTVGGEVVASLTLGATTNVTMPDVVQPDTGESTFVTLDCSNTAVQTVTYDALGGNPFADGTAANTAVMAGSANKVPGNETGTCGNVAVAGKSGFYYTISTTVTTASGGTGITLSAPTCRSKNNDSLTQGLLTGGTDNVYCGATITVADTAAAASYTAANAGFRLDVVYD